MTEGRSAVSLDDLVAVHVTPPFLPEDLAVLMPRGIDMAEAADRLNSAIRQYAVGKRRNTSLSHRGVARQARAIADATRKTLNAAGIIGQSVVAAEHIYDGLGHGALFAAAANDRPENGEQSVLAAFQAINDLHRWATVIQRRYAELAKLQPTLKSGPRPDTEFDRFMASVAAIYRIYFLDDPLRDPVIINQNGTGDDEGFPEDNPEGRRPSGPFFELLFAATKRMWETGLCAKMSRDALARRWWRLKLQNKSAK